MKYYQMSNGDMIEKLSMEDCKNVDDVYKMLVHKIYAEGQDQKGSVRAKYADGTPAYTRYLPNSITLKFKPEWGLPIITSKVVPVKSMLAELDWIWRLMSNDVRKLRSMNCTIWDEWEQANGTIGKAYGYQLAKKCRKVTITGSCYCYDRLMNQVEYVLHELENNPKSRRIMTTLYDVDDLDEMALEPCVFMTNWQVDENNRLHLNVVQRSMDTVLGCPYNWSQYGVLHRRIAQCLGYELGNMNWTVFNAHIYDRHLDLVLEQVQNSNSSYVELYTSDNLSYFNVPFTEFSLGNYNPIEKDKPLKERKYRYEVAI